MKHISPYIAIICIFFGMSISSSFATTSTLSTTAPIVGSAVGENAGNLIFNYEVGVPGPSEVSINANTLVFAGTFWSENVGWCTFNGLGLDGAKLTGVTNTLPMIGFAWCQNAGWISFNPRNVINTSTLTNSDAFFDKSTGLFHGFAWSENLGWINMEGLMTDITAPDISNFNPFAANSSKVFTVNASPVVPTGSSYTFTVDNWNGGNHTYIETVPSFTHDFRQAKFYSLKITDPFGNSSEGNVQVVANVPADTLNVNNIWWWSTASTYSSTFADLKVWDATQTHSMSLKFHDQYGNPVINVPGIKTINVRVAFNNNVDKNQLLSIGGILGDAIQFPGNTFAWLTYIGGTVGTDSNTSGDYSLNISSYAPTKAGYTFTNPNNISLQRLSYEIVANSPNTWVGEVAETDKKSKIGTNNLGFSPALFIGNVTNTDYWSIRQGYDTTFNATLLTGTTVPLTNPKVAHILDIDSNVLISYQNPSNITGGTKDCDGYMKTITTFNGAYTFSSALCNRPDSSNILMTPTTLGSIMSFSWKPTIIYAAPSNSVVKYTSEISYTNPNGVVDVKYPSYARSTSSSTLADGTTVTVTNGVVNQSVKILGMSNSRNTFDILSGNDTNKVWSLTRTDIKNLIHKNVELMTKWGVPASARYEVHTGDYTIPEIWPVGKDTIIIKWGDVTIDSNISNGSTMKSIIALKDSMGTGGKIKI
ncbi:MAG: hypothetical protein ACD_71C00181G0001, partial [uncultured bacterium (gcode 4)]